MMDAERRVGPGGRGVKRSLEPEGVSGSQSSAVRAVPLAQADCPERAGSSSRSWTEDRAPSTYRLVDGEVPTRLHVKVRLWKWKTERKG